MPLALLRVDAIPLEVDPLGFLIRAVPLFQFLQRDALQIVLQLRIRGRLLHLGLYRLWISGPWSLQTGRLLYRLEDLILNRSGLLLKGCAQLLNNIRKKLGDDSQQRKHRKPSH